MSTQEGDSYRTLTGDLGPHDSDVEMRDTAAIPATTDQTPARNYHMRLRPNKKPRVISHPAAGGSSDEEGCGSNSESSDESDSTPEPEFQVGKRRPSVKKRKRGRVVNSFHSPIERTPAPGTYAQPIRIDPDPARETGGEGPLSFLNAGLRAPPQPLNRSFIDNAAVPRAERTIAPMPSRNRMPALGVNCLITAGNNQETVASEISQRPIAPVAIQRIAVFTRNFQGLGIQSVTAPRPVDSTHNPARPPPGTPANPTPEAKDQAHWLKYKDTPQLALCKAGEPVAVALARLKIPPRDRGGI